jgi:hypothetical protein
LNPKLRGFLARAVMIGGIAVVASVLQRSAPRDQTLVVRLNSRQVTRVSGVITRQGESEPAAGFSQDFMGRSPAVVRHTFSAPNDTYIVVITLQDKPAAEGETRAPAPSAAEAEGMPPIPGETSFERRVSLVGGELTLSPE